MEYLEACNTCFDSCLKEDDVKMMTKCIRYDRACADACMFAIQAMVSNSPFIDEICNLCADICERCAEECAKHNHEHCQQCARTCQKCADACRNMSA
ncbi:four-helix bundle copper-binding protein [Viridibacillus arenosi]